MPKATLVEPAAPASGTVVKKTVTETVTGTQPSIPGNPVYPQQDEDINQWFGRLTDIQRVENLVYYLYRLDPNIEIVRKAMDNDKGRGAMLAKLDPQDLADIGGRGAFLPELSLWVIRKGFGGGPYCVWINYTKERGRTLFKVNFDVEGEPQLTDREEWKGGQRAQGNGDSQLMNLVRYFDGKIASIHAGAEKPQDAYGEAMKVAGDMMGKTLDIVVQRMPKPDDPTAQLSMFSQMLTMFNNIRPKESTKSDMELFKEFIELQKLMAPSPAPPLPPAPVLTEATVNDLLRKGIEEAVRGLKGRNSAPADGGFGKVILDVVQPLMPALVPLGLAAAQWLRAKTGTAAPPAANVPAFQPPLGGPTQRLSAPTAPPNAYPIQPPPQQAQPAPAQSPQPIPVTEAEMFIKLAKIQLAGMLTRGVAGNEAAASLERMVPEVYGELKAYGPDAILAYVAMDPVLSTVKDHPRLKAFVAEFCAYCKGEEAEPEVKEN